MILVDSSVWVGHFRQADPRLLALLNADEVLCHPVVIGEIAVGNLRNRVGVLSDLATLPSAILGTHEDVMELIERRQLYGTGVGYNDAHLLASALLTPSAHLWTQDARFAAAASRLGVLD